MGTCPTASSLPTSCRSSASSTSARLARMGKADDCAEDDSTEAGSSEPWYSGGSDGWSDGDGSSTARNETWQPPALLVDLVQADGNQSAFFTAAAEPASSDSGSTIGAGKFAEGANSPPARAND